MSNMSSSDDQFNSGMRNRLNRFDKTNNDQPVSRQDGHPPKKNFQKILEDKPEAFEGVEVEGEVAATIKTPIGASSIFSFLNIDTSKGTLGNQDLPNENESLAALATFAKQAGSSSLQEIAMSNTMTQIAPQAAQVKTDSIFGMSATTNTTLQDSKKMLRTDQGMMSLMGVANTKVEQVDLNPTSSSVADAPPTYAKLKVADTPDMNLNAGLQSAIVASNAANAMTPIENVQNNITAQNAAPTTRIQELKDIVDQIVKALTVISQHGKTETTVTLKGLPLFEGSSLRLTTYDTAPGQFNVAFSDLKPEALLLIQQKQRDGSLQDSLAQKGYMVHIVVATSQHDEVRILPEEQRYAQDNKNPQQQKQKQKGEEEEA